MQPFSHRVKNKFKTVKDIVHGKNFVVVVAFCLEKLYNKKNC